MKKLLFLSVLSLSCAGNPGAVSAQPGVQYPYVANDAKGNPSIIVCRDYQGGMNPGYILTFEELYSLYQYRIPTDRSSYNKFSPRFQVAYKDATQGTTALDPNVCRDYREGTTTENVYTWRIPTERELWLICIMETRGLLGGIAEFRTDQPYWAYTSYNASDYLVVRFGGRNIINNEMSGALRRDALHKSGEALIRCIRDLDFVYPE